MWNTPDTKPDTDIPRYVELYRRGLLRLDEQITHRVVDMKGLIEKIREQVQNLE